MLAGGKGTRLAPATWIMNKHLIPILNRPMILSPIETLKHLGITEIMVVSGGDHIGDIAQFLGDGSTFGVSLTYRVQEQAGGIAQALGLAKEFVGQDSVAVILGDNVFESDRMPEFPLGAGTDGAYFIFAKVDDPQRFGVPVFSGDQAKGDLIRIDEKPKAPQSKFAVTGFYLYPPNVFDVIKDLKPSKRGELEITDVNNWYIDNKKYTYSLFRGFWSDCGTPESLFTTIKWVYEGKK